MISIARACRGDPEQGPCPAIASMNKEFPEIEAKCYKHIKRLHVRVFHIHTRYGDFVENWRVLKALYAMCQSCKQNP